MQVETAAIDGTYEELTDAAEDIGEILSAKASDRLDLAPMVECWLVDQLERIELALANRLDSRPTKDATRRPPEPRLGTGATARRSAE